MFIAKCLILLALAQEVADRELETKLDSAVRKATGGEFWGAVLVAKKGKPVLSKGYGFADYDRRPNTPESLFEIASTSKMFTAAAILKLEMEGKLRTDDPVSKFFKNLPEDRKGITVHHLLTHTSGINEENVDLEYGSTATRDEAVAELLKDPPKTKPGERFAYSNGGYALLAAIVEVASGQSYETYVKEKLFKPAGMADTGFIQDKQLDARRATSRKSEHSTEWTALNWFWGWGYRGMGGVVTTASDLLKWDRALRGDALLDKRARDKACTPFKERYAYGCNVETTPRGTAKVWHAGAVEGYRAQFARYLEEDTVVVVLSNEDWDVFAVEQAITDLLFPSPVIDVHLSWRPYELAEDRILVLPKTVVWKAKRSEKGIALVLEDPDKKYAVASIGVTSGMARKLVADLESALEGTKAGGGRATKIFLPSSAAEGSKELRRAEEETAVLACKGEDVDEESISFILGGWRKRDMEDPPPQLMMAPPAARELLEQLRAALK